MITDICNWSIKGLDTLKKELEKDYGVYMEPVNLIAIEDIDENKTVYSLLSEKRKTYALSFFELFNDTEPKSKQLINKYRKPNIEEKYDTYVEASLTR